MIIFFLVYVIKEELDTGPGYVFNILLRTWIKNTIAFIFLQEKNSFNIVNIYEKKLLTTT